MNPANANLAPSQRLIDAIKQFEGFAAIATHEEGDPPGVITGGYGETQCTEGEFFTPEGAEMLLRRRIKGFGDQVLAQVNVPLTQGEYDALADLAYNVGAHGFPTLLEFLNAGDYAKAAACFAEYDRANGLILSGLQDRRAEEKQWFDS